MNFKRTNTEVGFARLQGRILYEARMARKMTREELAQASGIHCQRIFRIEMGDSTARAYDLAMMAEAMNVPLATLFPTAAEREPAQRNSRLALMEPEGAFA